MRPPPVASAPLPAPLRNAIRLLEAELERRQVPSDQPPGAPSPSGDPTA
jgi:hypothetical protein